MGFFTFIKPRVEIPLKLIVYLDAGKGNTRGAIVQMQNEKPHILYAILGEQRTAETESVNDTSNIKLLASFEEIQKQFARILQKISDNKIKYTAEEIYCILAAPYYLCHTSLINYKSEKPTVVTQSFIKNLLKVNQKEIPTTRKDINIGSNKRTLHEKIIGIKINGYHNNNPYGKSVQELQVSVFRTQIDEDLYQNLSQIIKKFTKTPYSVEALSLASFIALRNRLDAESDFIFTTVGNEITEVSLVKDHTLLETISFPFGKYSLIRTVANKIGQPPDIAISKIGLYYDNKLHLDEMLKLKPLLDEAKAEWFSYLGKTLVTLSEEITLPDQVYLVVDTDLKDLFESVVTQSSFASQTLVPSGFHFHTLDTVKFADCCTFEKDIKFDTLLAISASFAGASKETLTQIYPQNS